MKLADYYIQAAEKSRWDYKLWIRYLNKNIQRENINLTDKDVKEIIESPSLEKWQKSILKLAMKKGSIIWEIVVEYSEPAQTWRLDEFKRKWKEKMEKS